MDTRYRQTLYATQTSQCGFTQGKFKPGQFSEEPSNDTPELTKDSTELGQDSSPGKQAMEKPGSICSEIFTELLLCTTPPAKCERHRREQPARAPAL